MLQQDLGKGNVQFAFELSIFLSEDLLHYFKWPVMPFLPWLITCYNFKTVQGTVTSNLYEMFFQSFYREIP